MCYAVDDLDLSFLDSQGGKQLCVAQMMIGLILPRFPGKQRVTCYAVDDLNLSFLDSEGGAGKELCVVQLMIWTYPF